MENFKNDLDTAFKSGLSIGIWIGTVAGFLSAMAALIATR